MDIIINGRSAVLKKDFSFDYICENRLFMGRDGYTLNIAFPLKDCPQNIAIFGHINRMDVAKDIVSLECAIIDGETSLFGALSVLKISEVEAECQFAEGRCAQTLEDPFEDVYISDLDLGTPTVTNPANISPEMAWKSIDDGASEVALPWVNENSPTAPNNWVTFSGGLYSWDAENKFLSWQPYLIVIARRICEAVGYEYDFSEWEDCPLRHLIICNTLPGGWEMKEYANMMPDWSVSEFFEKLELFLMCEFDFDHKGKTVGMRFISSVLAEVAPVKIDDVVDSYSVDVSQDGSSSCSYMGARRIAFKECSHAMWPFYSCDWYVSERKAVKHYDTLADLLAANRRRDSYNGVHRVEWGQSMGEGYLHGLTTVSCLMYAADVDAYFVFRSYGTELVNTAGGKDNYAQLYELQPVNVFGSGSVESEDAQSDEIEFVPVCVMDTNVSDDDDMGRMMFLNPGSSSGASSSSGTGARPGNGGYGNGSFVSGSESDEIRQPGPVMAIENGRQSEQADFYSEVYVAFWTGTIPEPGKSPYPIIDGYSMVSRSWTDIRMPGLSMRLSGALAGLAKINPSQKFKFSWISSDLPDPRAIFNIRGQRYVCEKITATFSTDGMSQLLKGEFYPLLED